MKNIEPITDQEIETHTKYVRNVLIRDKALERAVLTGGVITLLLLISFMIMVLKWHTFTFIGSICVFNYILYVFFRRRELKLIKNRDNANRDKGRDSTA
jgi:1,4-dihydroxy-2-naphthoate octaprenyltransferase